MFTAFMVVMVILAYAWILYPGIMLMLSRKRPAAPAEPISDDEAPEIAILLSAHNEEQVIGARLSNLTALHYPHDRVTIHVGLDGCTDRTASIVRDWAELDSRIHVASADVCQGKTRMLKRLVKELSSQPPALPTLSPPYLLFTDANTIFEREAVRRLLARFSDPRVGGVCGKLVFVSRATSPDHSATVHIPSRGTDESTYWNWETRLKEAESRLDSCLGANGAIYAIRRELFPQTLPDNVIIDDFVIGMKVREQGFRMVFEPLAVAREDLPESVQDEWRRRVRIGSGAFQALTLCRACLSPRLGVFAWMFWSHKVLRWFTPHLLCVLVVIMGWAAASWAWRTEGYVVNLTAVGLMLAFVCGLVLAEVSTRCMKGVDRGLYFLTMQAALLAGFFRFCRGNLSGKWERTGR